MAGANGAIIKTTNGGNTFKPIFDEQSSGSIGAIAVAPSDPNIVYVGTGEGNPRNNASVGDGMYKSIDGGEHWTHIGLEKSDKIARIIVDAKNPDIVYACGLGREWGRTRSAASSRRPTAAPRGRRCCTSTRRRRAATSRPTRTTATSSTPACTPTAGGRGTLASGERQHRRVQVGERRRDVEKLSGPDRFRGLPRKAMDRIGVAVAPSDPNIVYVISETKDEGELWRSDDAGRTWRTVSSDRNINFRPFYYADIRVDPEEPESRVCAGRRLYFSEDGGQNFRTIARDVHGDHRAMWIDPVDPRYILNGNDGGWSVSRDGGRNWDIVNTFPFTQFYHINYDMQVPYRVCGGLQDNGTWCGPSNRCRGRASARPTGTTCRAATVSSACRCSTSRGWCTAMRRAAC